MHALHPEAQDDFAAFVASLRLPAVFEVAQPTCRCRRSQVAGQVDHTDHTAKVWKTGVVDARALAFTTLSEG